MNLIYKKSFVKAYLKLSTLQRSRVDHTILLFIKHPFHPSLKNHQLHGLLTGKRAISAGFDLRVIFKEENNYTIVYLLSTGTCRSFFYPYLPDPSESH